MDDGGFQKRETRDDSVPDSEEMTESEKEEQLEWERSEGHVDRPIWDRD